VFAHAQCTSQYKQIRIKYLGKTELFPQKKTNKEQKNDRQNAPKHAKLHIDFQKFPG
jgi:hypothetical protein